ncbi:MAG: hypothetical protein ACLF0G_01740 [Candidatus Brocadiia bacterium]
MRRSHAVRTAACVALVAVGLGVAWAQEADRGPAARRPLPPRPGGEAPEGRPRPRPAVPGGDVPAVQEEMERHRGAMREIFVANIALAREVGRAVHQLRQAGADEAELEEATAQFAPQADEIAAKLAKELSTHYANLARIFEPQTEEQRRALLAQLAQSTVRRMAERALRRPPRPQGDRPPRPPRPRRDGGGPPRRPGPQGPEGEAPANF